MEIQEQEEEKGEKEGQSFWGFSSSSSDGEREKIKGQKKDMKEFPGEHPSYQNVPLFSQCASLIIAEIILYAFYGAKGKDFL